MELVREREVLVVAKRIYGFRDSLYGMGLFLKILLPRLPQKLRQGAAVIMSLLVAIRLPRPSDRPDRSDRPDCCVNQV